MDAYVCVDTDNYDVVRICNFHREILEVDDKGENEMENPYFVVIWISLLGSSYCVRKLYIITAPGMAGSPSRRCSVRRHRW